MCGILGVHFKHGFGTEDVNFIKKLMYELKIRGKHSYGLCYYEDNQYKVTKTFEFDVDKLLENFLNSKARSFIYHNRYSTSGDYKDMNNNAPIVVEGLGAIAMNGVISMKNKQEYEEEYGIKCSTDNDAEIFLRLHEKNIHEDILNKYPNWSFASVLLQEDTLYALRNNKRPLYKYETDSIIIFVSTIDTIIRTGDYKGKVNVVEPFKLISVV